jgi:hypothetical protein
LAYSISETPDFEIEITGPLKLLQSLYLISNCPVSFTFTIRIEPGFSIIVPLLKWSGVPSSPEMYFPSGVNESQYCNFNLELFLFPTASNIKS